VQAVTSYIQAVIGYMQAVIATMAAVIATMAAVIATMAAVIATMAAVIATMAAADPDRVRRRSGVRVCTERRWRMRTTPNIDEAALQDAMKVSPEKTKTDVINEALREYARRRRGREVLKFEGRLPWEGDLDDLRLRSEED
jgi:Arc/MetJ family transcription regulator